MARHKSVTIDRVMEAVRADDNTGICVKCGEEQTGCEPDMRGGKCESCGEHSVFGAEELMFHMGAM